MTRFRLLFAFDVIVTLFVLQQLVSLLGERSFYGMLLAIEFAILAICLGSLYGAAVLRMRGRPGLGDLVLLIPAVPALLALLGMALLIFLFSMGGHH